AGPRLHHARALRGPEPRAHRKEVITRWRSRPHKPLTAAAVGGGPEMKRSGRSAQGLVEFALVLPILMMFLAVVVDLGRFLHVQLMLEQLTADAAAYAIVKDEATGALPTAAEITARLANRYPAMFKPYAFDVNVAAKVDGDDAVTCSLSTSVRPFLLHVLGAKQQTYTLSAAAAQPRR